MNKQTNLSRNVKINARKRKPLKLHMRIMTMRVVFDDVLFNVDVWGKTVVVVVDDSDEISSVVVAARSIFDLIRTKNAEVMAVVVVVVVVVDVRFGTIERCRLPINFFKISIEFDFFHERMGLIVRLFCNCRWSYCWLRSLSIGKRCCSLVEFKHWTECSEKQSKNNENIIASR